jgi:hypothetical protein
MTQDKDHPHEASKSSSGSGGLPDCPAIAAAEAELLAAREAWRAERGDVPPAPASTAGDAPDAVKQAERNFLRAREAWFADPANKRPLADR